MLTGLDLLGFPEADLAGVGWGCEKWVVEECVGGVGLLLLAFVFILRQSLPSCFLTTGIASIHYYTLLSSMCMVPRMEPRARPASSHWAIPCPSFGINFSKYVNRKREVVVFICILYSKNTQKKLSIFPHAFFLIFYVFLPVPYSIFFPWIFVDVQMLFLY